MSKKLIAAAALVIFQRKSIPTTGSLPITQVLAANQNPRSKRLKMKLALGVRILNQDGHLSRTELFDKIYVFSLSTSQHEDALSHEYTNLSKLDHNSIVTT